MINTTLSIEMIKSGTDLALAIKSSIDKTNDILFKLYPKARSHDVEAISTKTFPQLLFFKYTYFHDQKNESQLNEEWCKNSFELCICPKDDIETLNSLFKTFSFYDDTSEVPKTTFKNIQVALRIFFYVMWSNRALLLPHNFTFPRSQVNHKWVEPALEIYPETLQLIKNTFLKDPRFEDLAEHISDSSTYLRDYAYKILITTDWLSIEDIKLEDIYPLRQAYLRLNEHSGSTSINSFPFLELLRALYSYANERCNFTIEELIEECTKPIVDDELKVRKSGVHKSKQKSTTEQNIPFEFTYNFSDRLLFLKSEAELRGYTDIALNNTYKILVSRHYQKEMCQLPSRNDNYLTPRLVFINLLNKKTFLTKDEIITLFDISNLDYVKLEDFKFLGCTFNDTTFWNLNYSDEIKIAIKIFLLNCYCKGVLLLPRNFKHFIANKDDWAKEYYPNLMIQLFPSGLVNNNEVNTSLLKLLTSTNWVDSNQISSVGIKELRCIEAKSLYLFKNIPKTKEQEFLILEKLYGNEKIVIVNTENAWAKLYSKYKAEIFGKSSKASTFNSVFNKLKTYIDALPDFESSQYPEIHLSPVGLDRNFLKSNHYETGFLKYLAANIKNTTYNSQLNELSRFFDWIELNGNFDFVNPIIDELDRKLSDAPSGTTKAPLSGSTQFPLVWSITASLCEFYWYLVSKNLYKHKQATQNDDVYDTEKLGFVPVFYFNDRIYPILFIPTKLTYENGITRKGRLYSYPTFQGLFENFIALETGLRHLHIRYLNYLNWFEKIDGSLINTVEDNKFTVQKLKQRVPCELHVNTDKVKTEPWFPTVSSRVIETLFRLQAFAKYIEKPIKKEWYNGVVGNENGKIASPFYIFDDLPENCHVISESTISNQFKRLLNFVDIQIDLYKLACKKVGALPKEIIASLSNSGIKAIDTPSKLVMHKALIRTLIKDSYYCNVSYETDVTPHAIRATVASYKVTLLPPRAVAESITGHESLASLFYYVKYDPVFLNELANIDVNEPSRDGVISNLFEKFGLINQKALQENIKVQIETDPVNGVHKLGGISFASEGNNHVYSGLIAIKNVSPDNIAYFDTHLCPVGGVCPKEVKDEVGEYKCGSCFYSIKTVDHLSSILAKVRQLEDEKDYLSDLSNRISESGSATGKLIEIDKKRGDISDELAAWEHTFDVLEAKRVISISKNKVPYMDSSYCTIPFVNFVRLRAYMRAHNEELPRPFDVFAPLCLFSYSVF